MFHIPQAQAYCKGMFNYWDPMITTPPGLYLISAFVTQLVQRAFNYRLDSIYGLRAINSVFGLSILLISAALAKELKIDQSLGRSLLIALLPTLYIFNFLYYTDVGSVFFTLLSYYGALRRSIMLYLVAGLISLTFRQTNIIWVAGFFVGDIVYRRSKKVAVKSSNVNKTIHLIFSSACKEKELVYAAFLLLGSFSAFIYWNSGSIVLGDKQSHQVCAHWAQLLYFCAFTFAFLAPAIINSLFRMKNISIFFAFTGLAFAATWFGTVQHPYLMADNRHWTNVIWRHCLNRRIYNNVHVRHILAPIYGLIIAVLNESLEQDILWKIGYLFASALSLIPSPLFEPRYYIIPTVIFILNMKFSKAQAKRTLLWVCLIDAVVIGTFLYRPFIWTSEPNQLQRYIW